MEGLLDGLNDAQRSAVTSPAHVVQVLAPPGSGKTRTLTARVAYHINHERLRPWNIIVCTFTIKAAHEMKERIKGFVGENLEAKLILGTFHSVARRFLARYGREIGVDQNFGIADTSDTTAILKRIIARYDYTVEPGRARSKISRLKAKGISAHEFATNRTGASDNELARIYSSYQDHLTICNLLDYDDLLMRCVELLQKFPSCVSAVEAVLIDEYQDTNNIQYELMKLLAQSTRRITIVGDPDQSIYSFRSAEYKNLLRMRDEFPESVVIHLENNYRSSGYILSSALAVIEQDKSRHQRTLTATHSVGEQPTLRNLASPYVEAKWLVGELQRTKSLSAGLLKYNDYAILLRSSPLSLQIERALAHAGIPYRMVAGTKFFDRAEIKLILDYLRVTSQPDHNDVIARIINSPARKVGDATIKALLEEAEARKATLWNVVLDIAQGRRRVFCKISTQAQRGIEQFADIILTLRKRLLSGGGQCDLLGLIEHILQKIAFQAYLKQAYRDNWQDRWANVEELLAQATQLNTSTASNEDSNDCALPTADSVVPHPASPLEALSKFLANITLSSIADQNGSGEDQVTISTIHAAKGLEWPVVFIPAVYEGSIPHSRADDHDEERRLLYVGMTRAQGFLYLSYPVTQSGYDQTTLSSFVSQPGVRSLFSEHGPDLAFKPTIIPDLARILQRQCPSTAEQNGARKQLEFLMDDQYPLGAKIVEKMTLSRRKCGQLDSNNSSAQYLIKQGNTGATTMCRKKPIEPTLNTVSQFSIISTTMHQCKTGFTSAKDLNRLHNTQDAANSDCFDSPIVHNQSHMPQSVLKRISNSKEGARDTKRGRLKGQGTITAFFERSSGGAPSITASSMKPKCSQIFSTTLQSHQDSPNGISNLYNSAYTFNNTVELGPSPDHKPFKESMVSKPARNNSGGENARHVLCSSSPIQGESHTKSRVNGDDALDSVRRTNQYTGGTPSASCCDVVTSQSTSMNQPYGRVALRRTLGARRTMRGWSVANKTMPKPRRD